MSISIVIVLNTQCKHPYALFEPNVTGRPMTALYGLYAYNLRNILESILIFNIVLFFALFM